MKRRKARKKFNYFTSDKYEYERVQLYKLLISYSIIIWTAMPVTPMDRIT